MNAPLNPDVCCRECALSGEPATRGAYSLFDCRQCRVRYAIDMLRRLSGNDAENTLDALFQELERQVK